jgi:hypothetical protein
MLVIECACFQKRYIVLIVYCHPYMRKPWFRICVIVTNDIPYLLALDILNLSCLGELEGSGID